MLIRSAAAAQRDDFLSGLPVRAGMASGEARRVGGRGRSLPCGCSDGPAASLRHAAQAASEDALLKAERSHQRARVAGLDEELLDEIQRGLERERENRHLRRRVDGLHDIDRERERARERVEELNAATEFSACGWRTSARSSRKRTDELEDARAKNPELSFSRFLAFSIMLIRSAAAARRDDFLGGLPMRAGMVYGEARRVGGGGRCQPCGRSDGPAASRAASRGCAAPGRASVLPAPHRVP